MTQWMVLGLRSAGLHRRCWDDIFGFITAVARLLAARIGLRTRLQPLEDGAGAICRAEVWLWVKHGASVTNGKAAPNSRALKPDDQPGIPDTCQFRFIGLEP